VVFLVNKYINANEYRPKKMLINVSSGGINGCQISHEFLVTASLALYLNFLLFGYVLSIVTHLSLQLPIV